MKRTEMISRAVFSQPGRLDSPSPDSPLNPQGTDESNEGSQPTQQINTINGGAAFPSVETGGHKSQPQNGSMFTETVLSMESRPATPPGADPPPRLDVDDANGQLRYYGPTTQPHIPSPVPSTERALTSCDDEAETGLYINMDSDQLKKWLLDRFWKMQPLSVTVVDQDLFMTQRALGKRTQFHTPFLEDAILACAARVSTSGAVRGLGAKYAERAKAEISAELEQPNMATLQGFLLLSDFEATRAHARTGWTYSGEFHYADTTAAENWGG